MNDAPVAEAVSRALRRLSRPELVAFVRDCYRARGWDARVDDDCVVATSGGSTRVVLPVATRRLPGGRPSPDRAVDVVFAAAATDRVRRLADALDARTVAGRAAAEMVLYGVDADERAALCRMHLGAEPDALRPPVTRRLRRGVATALAALQETTVNRPVVDGTGRAVLALVVVGLVPLALVAGGGIPGVAPGADVEPDPTTAESAASSAEATPVRASDASGGAGVHHLQPNGSASTESSTGSGTDGSTLHHLRAHVIPTSTDACRGSGSCASATAPAASDDERDGPTLQELWPTGARATSADCLNDAACASSAIVAADEGSLGESTMHHLRSHVRASDER